MRKTLHLTLALLLLAGAGGADEPSPVRKESQVIEEILELQRQIDELMATLPPETLEELRIRLAERAAPGAPAPKPDAAPVPPPAPAPPIVVPPPAVVAPPAAVTPPVDTPQPAVEPPSAVEPPPEMPVRRRRLARPHCNFLDLLDENQDGRLSAQDRYWRHLNLWTDADGDRAVDEREVESTWERNVREIAVELDTFVRKKGTIGEVRVDGHVRLDLGGDGFGAGADPVLVVDVTRLKRGTGPEVLSAAGEPLEGLQPFQEGWRIREHDGRETVLRCP